MRIIALSTLKNFWEKYPDAELPLRSWYAEASRAKWKIPADIKAAYRNAGGCCEIRNWVDVHPIRRDASPVRQDRRGRDLRG